MQSKKMKTFSKGSLKGPNSKPFFKKKVTILYSEIKNDCKIQMGKWARLYFIAGKNNNTEFCGTLKIDSFYLT